MVEAKSGAMTDICKRRLHLALLPLQSSTAVVGSDLSLPGGASTSLQRNRRARHVEENVEAATSVLSGVDLDGASDACGGWSLGRGAVVGKRRRCGGLEIVCVGATV
jgi:hypothetical protein